MILTVCQITGLYVDTDLTCFVPSHGSLVPRQLSCCPPVWSDQQQGPVRWLFSHPAILQGIELVSVASKGKKNLNHYNPDLVNNYSTGGSLITSVSAFDFPPIM